MINTSDMLMIDGEKPLASDATRPDRKLYFINEIVEWQLTKYIWTGCTSVQLRDIIMSNASELIRQIIRTQRLHNIYPGHEDSAFGDLQQTAWMQIEKTLYKYRSIPHCRLCYKPDRPSQSILYSPSANEYGIKTFEDVMQIHGSRCPHCDGALTASPIIEVEQGRYGGSSSILYRGASKVFNMWSQIARTVILAYIKKESRDKRNSTTYKTHLVNKNKPLSTDFAERFIQECYGVCDNNDEYIMIVDNIKFLLSTDDRPYDGLISKLVHNTGLSRQVVTGFMKYIKLRSHSFTDSPITRYGQSTSESSGDDDDNDE